MDVFFFEAFEEEAEQIRRFLSADIEAGFTDKTIQEWGQTEAPASIISIRTQSVIPSGWALSLKGILTRSSGYDHIKRYLSETSALIASGYLPEYCQRAVAEQALLLWLGLLRKLPQQIKNFKTFGRSGLTGFECRGKRLLVVGVGNIGSEIVRLGKDIGMDVRGVDLIEKHSDIDYVTIEDGLAKADVIVCAMNLTSENKGYFDYELLSKARQSAVFVNIARGELSPSCELLRLLKEKKIGGVGLDVYNHESDLAVALRSAESIEDKEIESTLALGEYPNVILTPHNAFNTRESVERKAEQSIQQICHFIENGQFLWPVPD